jgi:pyridinium-3,5-biscarboxylic acid mononucleotide synthase
MNPEHRLDLERADRVGMGEALLCSHKSAEQIAAILEAAHAAKASLLLTRLERGMLQQLPAATRGALDYDPVSRTAYFGSPSPLTEVPAVLIVTGGTSDVPVAREASRTLAFYGQSARALYDVGVAGLHRVLALQDELAAAPVIIAVAGFEGALFSVLGGLVKGVLIAVPTSVGLGVAAGGAVALNAALGSCAPGILTVNIDNGFGAACAALRVVSAHTLAAKKMRVLG